MPDRSFTDNEIELAPPPRILLISGSDSAGAAGIQADMATCFGLNAHPLSAITALTAQDGSGVRSVNPTSTSILDEQLLAALSDGHVAAVKIGLLSDASQADVVKTRLSAFRARHHTLIPVIWDPVMTSTSGAKFTQDTNWMSSFLSCVDMVTPNINEAERLTDTAIERPENMLAVAVKLHKLGAKGVWLKGGHRQFPEYPGKHIDLLLWQDQYWWMIQDKVHTTNSRGTGCTLATAVATFYGLLTQQKQQDSWRFILDAAVLASAYVHQGLRAGYGWEALQGPVAHRHWPMEFADYPQIFDDLNWLKMGRFPSCGVKPLGLYPVVDSLKWLERLVRLGVETIQLRIKNVPHNELESIVEQAVTLCEGSACRLFINDYWQLAIKYQAYGVHLGQEDIAEADLQAIQRAGVRLGISTHGEFEWARAASLQPSYLAIGAIYPTDTKEVIVVGENNLYRWVSILKEQFPLTAIGGINHQNMDTVLQSGVQSAAVVSAITKADDYRKATESLFRFFS